MDSSPCPTSTDGTDNAPALSTLQSTSRTGCTQSNWPESFTDRCFGTNDPRVKRRSNVERMPNSLVGTIDTDATEDALVRSSLQSANRTGSTQSNRPANQTSGTQSNWADLFIDPFAPTDDPRVKMRSNVEGVPNAPAGTMDQSHRPMPTAGTEDDGTDAAPAKSTLQTTNQTGFSQSNMRESFYRSLSWDRWSSCQEYISNVEQLPNAPVGMTFGTLIMWQPLLPGKKQDRWCIRWVRKSLLTNATVPQPVNWLFFLGNAHYQICYTGKR